MDEHHHAGQLFGPEGETKPHRISLITQTVIIAYVTVPSLASFPSSARYGEGLKPTSNSMEDLLSRYTVREVVLVCVPTRISLMTRVDLDPREEETNHITTPSTSVSGGSHTLRYVETRRGSR